MENWCRCLVQAGPNSEISSFSNRLSVASLVHFFVTSSSHDWVGITSSAYPSALKQSECLFQWIYHNSLLRCDLLKSSNKRAEQKKTSNFLCLRQATWWQTKFSMYKCGNGTTFSVEAKKWLICLGHYCASREKSWTPNSITSSHSYLS